MCPRGARRALAWLLAAAALASAEAWRPGGADPYAILGLERGRGLDEASLKRAYRKAALRWHPDKVGAGERAEAERKFVEIAWAYEALGEALKRGDADPGPQPGAGGQGGGADGGQRGGEQGGGGGAHGGQRDFSMDAAAKVFRDVFGRTSAEYQDLIQHLMASAGSGDKATWRRHADAIKRALEGRGHGADGDFDVETHSEEPGGTERVRTKRTTSSDGKGTTTKKTETHHSSTRTTVAGGASALPGSGGSAHDAHMLAHEAAVRAAEEQHRAALGRLHQQSAHRLDL